MIENSNIHGRNHKSVPATKIFNKGVVK
jgi:hypothetical protein